MAVNWNESVTWIMISIGERVVHTTFQKNELCYAFLAYTGPSVKGLSSIFSDWNHFYMILFSYNGFVFHNQADSKNDHYLTTLAMIDEDPMAVGSFNKTNKAEVFDISSNVWTEVAEYPYHD